MNFKRIVGAWLGHGTVFELEDGMFALVDHEVSTSEARFSAIAGSLLRGYAENPENLPVGNCDADIAVLKSLEKPDPYYGMGKERFEAQLARRDALRRNLGIPDDQSAVAVLLIGKADTSSDADAVSAATTRKDTDEVVTKVSA